MQRTSSLHEAIRLRAALEMCPIKGEGKCSGLWRTFRAGNLSQAVMSCHCSFPPRAAAVEHIEMLNLSIEAGTKSKIIGGRATIMPLSCIDGG